MKGRAFINIVALLVTVGGIVQVRGEPPELTSIRPLGLIPGVTNRMVMQGKRLAEVHSVWTSWAGTLARDRFETWDAKREAIAVPLWVRRHQSPGVEMIRLIGTNGVSNPMLLLIDGLPVPEGAMNGRHGASERSVQIPTVAALDDVCAEREPRYYRLKLERGQRISIEIVANRTGGAMDPVLRILDSARRELVYVNDTPGLGSDCAIEFRAPATDEYLAEVRDSEYGGGDEYRYRLRVGGFPVAIVPAQPSFETGVQRGSEITWRSTVSARSGRARPIVRGRSSTTARLRVVGKDKAQTLTARLAVTPEPALHESEPNNDLAAATPIEPRGFIHGQFDTAGDQDLFRMVLSAPGRWRFQVHSRSLGFVADPLLRLLDATGKTIATADMDALDPRLQYHFKKAGTYYVGVEEAAAGYGLGRSYALSVEPGAPGFEMSAELDCLNIPAGDKGTLKVTIDRQGYQGPIRMELDGLPTGFSLGNPVVPADKKAWDLEVQCDGAVSPGTAGLTRLVARPEEEHAGGSTLVELGPAMRRALPKLLVIPWGTAEGFWVCAVAPSPPRPAAEKSGR